jgi:hypothetical protein
VLRFILPLVTDDSGWTTDGVEADVRGDDDAVDDVAEAVSSSPRRNKSSSSSKFAPSISFFFCFCTRALGKVAYFNKRDSIGTEKAKPPLNQKVCSNKEKPVGALKRLTRALKGGGGAKKAGNKTSAHVNGVESLKARRRNGQGKALFL